MLHSERTTGPRVGYVLKVYPRFSETFIVTEMLAREAAGENLEIFSLRPPADPRFHPELARIKAPVTYLAKPAMLRNGWDVIAQAHAVIPGFAGRFAAALGELVALDPSEVQQGIELATRAVLAHIDHLHAHFGSLAAQTAQIASQLTGIPYSFTAHAKDIFHESVDYDRLRSTLRNADHVVTISAYNYRFLAARFPAETTFLHLIHNGVELQRFPYCPPSAVPGPVLRIAAVGRLVEKKGFPLLIAAVAQLMRDGVRVDLRIAGGGELEAELAAQISAAGLWDAVSLLGPQTQAEVTDLLRWADVFAAPCVVGTDGNADGLPTVLLEAMAMGVPSIASDVTGIPEVVRTQPSGAPDTGILVRSGSLTDLTAALMLASSEQFDRQRVARSARQLIEAGFDSRRQAQRLQSLLPGRRAVQPDTRLLSDPARPCEEVA